MVKLSATAATSQRFTGNQHGAMLGWEMAPDQLGEDRPGVTGPLRNLYFTGHWTQPGGGITPVMVSAINAAKCIVSGDRRRAEDERPSGRWPFEDGEETMKKRLLKAARRLLVILAFPVVGFAGLCCVLVA